jgi:hypothetical protein
MKNYKLANQIEGKGNFAVVSGFIENTKNTDSCIVVGSKAFDWIKQTYGDDTVLPKGDDEFVNAAIRGGEIALRELGVKNKRIIFEEIHFLTVDTNEINMALAAYQLVFQLVTGKEKFEKVDSKALGYIAERL